jgi:cytochrome c oxidase subunit 2
MHSITIDASNFAFTPNAITVKRGENVTLVLKDVSGTHGFAVPDLNIDVAMQEGDTKTIVLPTSTVGTFPFHCSIPCGPGHRDMTGQIVIE